MFIKVVYNNRTNVLNLRLLLKMINCNCISESKRKSKDKPVRLNF